MEHPIVQGYHEQCIRNLQKRRSWWYAVTFNPKGKEVSEEELISRLEEHLGKYQLDLILYVSFIIENSPKNHAHGVICTSLPLGHTPKDLKIEGITPHIKKLKSIVYWERYCMKDSPISYREYYLEGFQIYRNVYTRPPNILSDLRGHRRIYYFKLED